MTANPLTETDAAIKAIIFEEGGIEDTAPFAEKTWQETLTQLARGFVNRPLINQSLDKEAYARAYMRALRPRLDQAVEQKWLDPLSKLQRPVEDVLIDIWDVEPSFLNGKHGLEAVFHGLEKLGVPPRAVCLSLGRNSNWLALYRSSANRHFSAYDAFEVACATKPYVDNSAQHFKNSEMYDPLTGQSLTHSFHTVIRPHKRNPVLAKIGVDEVANAELKMLLCEEVGIQDPSPFEYQTWAEMLHHLAGPVITEKKIWQIAEQTEFDPDLNRCTEPDEYIQSRRAFVKAVASEIRPHLEQGIIEKWVDPLTRLSRPVEAIVLDILDKTENYLEGKKEFDALEICREKAGMNAYSLSFSVGKEKSWYGMHKIDRLTYMHPRDAAQAAWSLKFYMQYGVPLHPDQVRAAARQTQQL